MKKFLMIMMCMCAIFVFSNTASAESGKILVAYFSRTGEEYAVGNITKGNTHIVADIIAKAVGADMFEIKPVKAYPAGYEACKPIASREKAMKARPKITNTINNFDEYDVIFLGYPIWYGDMPMIMYTFVESYDFSSKKIIPFCTHGGSGLSSTDQALILACPNSQILQGFSIAGSIAQKSPQQAEPKVMEWLNKIGMMNNQRNL